MHKRKWVLVLALLLVAVAAFMTVRDQGRAPSGPPFADLDTVLATQYQNDWSVLTPPKREGPYRLTPSEPQMVPRNSGKGMTYRLRTQEGVEEVHLDGGANYDQLLIELETRDGRRTVVVLKRSG